MNKKHTEEQNNTLLVVILTSYMSTFNASALNLSIPNIGAEFNASAQLVGWIVTLFTLLNVALSLPFGKLSDITDKVRIFRAGVLIFSAGIFVCAFSQDIWMMLASRAVQGIGAAMIFATNMAILIDAFSPQERGRVLGISVSFTYIGLSTGPVLGGIINNYLGWRYIMILAGVLALFVIYVMYKKLHTKNNAKANFKDFDAKGSALYTLAMMLVLYGFAIVGSGMSCWIIIAVGIVLAVAFVKCELNAKDPMLKVVIFKNKGFTYSALAAFMNYAATMSVSYFMSIYLQVVKGYPSQIAGFVLITAPVIQAIFSPVAGRLSDKHSPYKLSSAGMGACAISLLLLCTMNEDTPIAMIIPMLAVMGVGFALFSTPNTNAMMSAVAPEDRGVASSIVATMRNAGASAAMAILTVVVGMKMGSLGMYEAPIELIVQTMHLSFMIFSGVCFAGIFLSLKRGK